MWICYLVAASRTFIWKYIVTILYQPIPIYTNCSAMWLEPSFWKLWFYISCCIIRPFLTKPHVIACISWSLFVSFVVFYVLVYLLFLFLFCVSSFYIAWCLYYGLNKSLHFVLLLFSMDFQHVPRINLHFPSTSDSSLDYQRLLQRYFGF